MLTSVGATRRQIKSSVKDRAAMLGVVGIPVGTMSGIFGIAYTCQGSKCAVSRLV